MTIRQNCDLIFPFSRHLPDHAQKIREHHLFLLVAKRHFQDRLILPERIQVDFIKVIFPVEAVPDLVNGDFVRISVSRTLHIHPLGKTAFRLQTSAPVDDPFSRDIKNAVPGAGTSADTDFLVLRRVQENLLDLLVSSKSLSENYPPVNALAYILPILRQFDGVLEPAKDNSGQMRFYLSFKF